MPDRPQFIPPHLPWNEADSICETALLYIDDPEDKESMRRLGRLIFNLAIETTRMPFEESSTHAEQMESVDMLAVEIRQYVSGQLRTLVPRVLGQTSEALGKKAGSPRPARL